KITAGRIELDFGRKFDAISSGVNIYTAVSEIKIDDDHRAEVFMSATRFVGAAIIYGDFKIGLHIPAYISDKADGGLRYPQAEIIREGDFIYYKQNTFTDFSYGIVCLQKRLEDRTELYFTVSDTNDAADYIGKGKDELLVISAIGYEKLKEEHIAWWKKYWSKSSVALNDFLIEKTYYRSMYLFASCSRRGFYPMPLQGVWTADNDELPPWKGDYHYDTNIELSYSAYLKANRLEEGSVLLDYLWNMRENFRGFTESFYNTDGILFPACSTIDGKPLGGWSHYALSPTMTVWAIQNFDEYYKYTGDIIFLKERAYPVFKEVATAVSGILQEEEGKLRLPVSTSPEIYDDTQKAYLTPDSNFDQALLLYLFKTLCGYCDILKESDEKWKSVLDKLEDISVSADKVIMLDRTQKLPESHRHFSHLMCIYPLHLFNYEGEYNKSVYEATISHIEGHGTGRWVGFSFAMMSQIYSMAEKGNAAYEKLRQFTLGFVAENGFHLNGDFKNYGLSQFHYRPFTLESLFGYCDALHEMLMQEHRGYLHLFPAIPADWEKRTVSFKNLRTYNGVLVSAKIRSRKLLYLRLKADGQKIIRIKNTFGKEQLTLSGGGTISCKEGEIFALKFQGKIEII
ncbi:MAG: hypothetical protein SO532_03190, partial [Candidatus Borkfalkiaceae bacterium]|nr:hypothetical protein [Christensenellaceae bacterium]